MIQNAEAGVTFKEVFYEEEMKAEAELKAALEAVDQSVEQSEKSREYKEIQRKIEKVYEDSNAVLKILKKQDNIISGSSLLAIGISSVSTSIFALLDILPLGVLSITAMIASVASVMFFTDKNNSQKEENKFKVANLLQDYRTELIHSYFEGKVLSEVADLKENWQKINVLENGEIVSYMVRIQTDKNGLENVESMKVVQS